MQVAIRGSAFWGIKGMLRLREEISPLPEWHKLLQQDTYSTRRLYQAIIGKFPNVRWKHMMFGNVAWKRTIHKLWMACHRKFPTKERLHKFGSLNDNIYGFEGEF